MQLAAGTYTGNGAASRIIDLGFQPKAVLVCNDSGQMGDSTGQSYYCGGLALPGHPIQVGENIALGVTSGGFQVAYQSHVPYIQTNVSGQAYYYLAFK